MVFLIIVVGCDPTCEYTDTELVKINNQTDENVSVVFRECDTCTIQNYTVGAKSDTNITLRTEKDIAPHNKCEDENSQISVEFSKSILSDYTVCLSIEQNYTLRDIEALCNKNEETITEGFQENSPETEEIKEKL